MDFTDISSYSDAQVPEKLKELESNKEFLGYIASLLFPKSNKYFSWLSNAYVGWKFNKLFSEYVKENDPDLWARAVDFAKDFTDVNGVTLNYIDKDEE